MRRPMALPTCSITMNASHGDSGSDCHLTMFVHPNRFGKMTVCPRLEIGNSSETPCRAPSTTAWKVVMRLEAKVSMSERGRYWLRRRRQAPPSGAAVNSLGPNQAVRLRASSRTDSARFGPRLYYKQLQLGEFLPCRGRRIGKGKSAVLHLHRVGEDRTGVAREP